MAAAEIEEFARFCTAMEGQPYYEKWQQDNPGQNAAWLAYRDRILRGERPTPPTMAGKFGKALVSAGRLALLQGGGGGSSASPFRVAVAYLDSYDPDHPAYPFSVERKGSIIREGRIGALAVKIHHGTHRYRLPPGFVSTWRTVVPYVFAWGWLDGDPVVEAKLAALAVAEEGLDGYIANAETAYEGSASGKSLPFVETWREVAPKTPLALSGLISYNPAQNGLRPFHYRPWVEAGAQFRPQAYDERQRLPIEWAYRYASLAGFPLAQTAPDLMAWGGSNVPDDVSQLPPDTRAGLGLFLGSQANDDDYRAVGRAIRDRGVAVDPTTA